MFPKALLKSRNEIAEIAKQFAHKYDFYYQNGSLNSLVHKMKGKIIIKPSKFCLIVHNEHDFEIYQSPYTSLWRDNISIAQAIGHYVLHYQLQLESHHDGFVCKNVPDPNNKNELIATNEAIWFQQELLLPEKEFIEFYNNYSLESTAYHFSVPTSQIEIRAKSLKLTTK